MDTNNYIPSPQVQESLTAMLKTISRLVKQLSRLHALLSEPPPQMFRQPPQAPIERMKGIDPDTGEVFWVDITNTSGSSTGMVTRSSTGRGIAPQNKETTHGH